jgi:hypothetical protein
MTNSRPARWLSHIRQNSDAVFRQFSSLGRTWAAFARGIYRYTDCGPAVGILFEGQSEVVWTDDLSKFPCEHVALEVHVSSIVEGVDATTSTQVVNLRQFQTTAQAVAAVAAAIETVNAEAEAIWRDTHGCQSCHRLNLQVDAQTAGLVDYEPGQTPVHPECPECGGHGVAI